MLVGFSSYPVDYLANYLHAMPGYSVPYCDIARESGAKLIKTQGFAGIILGSRHLDLDLCLNVDSKMLQEST